MKIVRVEEHKVKVYHPVIMADYKLNSSGKSYNVSLAQAVDRYYKNLSALDLDVSPVRAYEIITSSKGLFQEKSYQKLDLLLDEVDGVLEDLDLRVNLITWNYYPSVRFIMQSMGEDEIEVIKLNNNVLPKRHIKEIKVDDAPYPDAKQYSDKFGSFYYQNEYLFNGYEPDEDHRVNVQKSTYKEKQLIYT